MATNNTPIKEEYVMKKIILGFFIVSLFGTFVFSNIQAKEKSLASVSISVDDSKKSDKDMVVIGKDLTIEKGQIVEGNAVVIKGNLNVRGTIKGNAVVILGDLTAEDNSVIEGDVVAIGGQLIQSDTAQIKGEKKVEKAGRGSVLEYRSYCLSKILHAFNFIPIIICTVSALLCLILPLLFPKGFSQLSELFGNQPLKSILLGVIGLILIPPVIITLAISIIGIPLIPFFILAIPFTAICGVSGICLFIGSRIAENAFRIKQPLIFLSALIGVVLIFGITLVPFLGMVIFCLISTVGFGLSLLAIFMKSKERKNQTTLPVNEVEKNPAPIRKDNNALVSFWCGIFSFIPFAGLVLSIVAIIFGILSLIKINKSEGKLGGFGFALAGLICGVVFILFNFVFIARMLNWFN